MKRDLLELASELYRRHRPYVVATVVWARGPSSGKQGGTAIIEADGTIHGWIGGACAEPAVLRESRRVLNDGTARLMYLGPPEELDGHTREGVITVPIACASEGALEVFMEPVLPQPSVVVVGRSPAVKTLASLLVAIDWRPIVVDDGGDGSGFDPAVEVVTALSGFPDIGIDDTTPVVIATQGHYDEPALEAALATSAPYIGLVGSVRRGESVIGYLRDRGVSPTELARIEVPAGLDLGRLEHREIAVAILARLVELRAAGAIGGMVAAPQAAWEPATAIDPVCGMTVTVDGARFTTQHEGAAIYFCCPACKNMFETDPAAYTSEKTA